MSSTSKKAKPHHSSFIHRIHQRHDQRHHPGEATHEHDPEQRPLLQDEHPDSASEMENEPLPPQQQRQTRSSRSKLIDTIAKTVSTASTKTAATAKDVTAAIMRNTSNTAINIKTSAVRLGKAVKRNPQRALATACMIFAAASFGEAVELYYHYKTDHNSRVCTSPSCVTASAGILHNLHPSFRTIDPCDNFDEFACGGFRLERNIFSNQNSVTSESLMQQQMLRDLRYILQGENFTASQRDFGIFEKLEDAYAACMDEATLRSVGLKSLKKYTEEVKVLFTQEKNALRTGNTFQSSIVIDTSGAHSLTAAYTRMMRMGVDAFVVFKVEEDGLHRDSQVLHAVPAPLRPPFSQALSFGGDLMLQYQTILENVLPQFVDLQSNKSAISSGSRTPKLSIQQLAAGVVRFESDLSAIVPNDDDHDVGLLQYNPMTFDQFDKLIPQISIRALVKEFAPQGVKADTVLVSSPVYVSKLSSLLSSTATEVLQAFAIWKVVQEHSDRTEDKILDEWKQFERKLDGRPFSEVTDRSEICLSSLNHDLPWILLYFYAKQYPGHQVKDHGDDVAGNLRNAFLNLLGDKKWVGKDDKDKLQDRIRALVFDIGYPTTDPDTMDHASVAKFYKTVHVRNDTFLVNKVSSVQNTLYQQWSRLGKHTDLRWWPMASSVIASHLEVKRAKAVIAATAMRPPFLFQPDDPPYLSYGAFGAIIGKAIAGAMNDTDLSLSSAGSLLDKLSNTTRTTIKRKASCFAHQYSNFSIEGPKGPLQVDGRKTMHDNIADAGGVHAAHTAWTQSELWHPSLKLPGLQSFSHEQLFWLSYANSMCSMMTAEEMANEISRRSLLPNPIRIRGTVSNSRAFRQAFKCPVKEPVCELW